MRVLFASAFSSIAAGLALYLGHAVYMPTSPDFEAGRVIRVRLGGQLWVYVTEREAQLHDVTTKSLFFVLCISVFLVLLLIRLEHRRR